MIPPDEPLWSVGPGRLAPLVGSAHADVCVVGLGGSGLAALRRLVDAGRRVVGIDAEGVAAGAAGRNGGFLLAGPAEFHHRLHARLGADLACRLYGLTLEARDRIIADTPGADPRGSLRLPASDDEGVDCRRHFERLIDDGFPAVWIEGPTPGLLVPGDGVFDPARRCLDLAHAVADRARLYGRTPALSVEPERVQTPHGEIRADVVLIAVDGGLERIMPSGAGSGGGVPEIQSLRLQMLGTAPAVDVAVPHAVYHRSGFDYWQQRPDGRIALGGGRDVGGDAELTVDRGVTDVVQTYLEDLLRRRVGTSAEVTHRWSGIVGYTADGLPVADEVEPGVLACGGYSGHGNVLGTLAGEGLADLALGRPVSSLVDWLRRARRPAQSSASDRGTDAAGDGATAVPESTSG